MYIKPQKPNVLAFALAILGLVLFVYVYFSKYGDNEPQKPPPVSRLGHLWSKYLPPDMTQGEWCPSPDSEAGKYLLAAYKEKFDDFYLHCNNIQRIGGEEEGGKFICIDALVPNDCIVYSLGSQLEFDFEIGLIKRFKCQVYTFDCTVGDIDGSQIPTGVHFYPWCISDLDERRQFGDDFKLKQVKEVQFYTLSTIMNKLGHHRIDLLKMDIERYEFPVILKMKQDVLPRQFTLEVHVENEHGLWGRPVLESEWRGLWDKLHAFGYGVFSYEPNPLPDCFCCVEYSLLLR